MTGWLLLISTVTFMLVFVVVMSLATKWLRSRGWLSMRRHPSAAPDWIWTSTDEQPGYWRKADPTMKQGNYAEFVPVVVAQGSKNDGVYRIPLNSGTWRIDGVEDGVEIHTGPLSPDVNWWELNQQSSTGGSDRKTP